MHGCMLWYSTVVLKRNPGSESGHSVLRAFADVRPEFSVGTVPIWNSELTSGDSAKLHLGAWLGLRMASGRGLDEIV
eukprot:COSAG02_NODE_247_length_27137_cov_61.275057_15_plen_77_part_00